MEKIKIENRVYAELTDLIDILYAEDYFGFLISTEEYVINIFNFIYTIPTLKYKPTYKNLFCSFYVSYKANKNTTWYIMFDIKNDIYLVSFITNNHSYNYPRLITGF
jgi:hypothetical protein